MHLQHSSQLTNGLVVAVGLEQDPSNTGAPVSERIKLTASPLPSQRLVDSTLAKQPP